MKKIIVLSVIALFIGVSIATSTGKIDREICKTTNFDGSLSGYVKNTSGNPIEGALVRVHFHGTYEEDYSDSTGFYNITNIPICRCLKYTTCSKENYKTKRVLLAIAENTTRDFILTSIDETLEYAEDNNEIEPSDKYTEIFTFIWAATEEFGELKYNSTGKGFFRHVEIWIDSGSISITGIRREFPWFFHNEYYGRLTAPNCHIIFVTRMQFGIYILSAIAIGNIYRY